MYFVSNILQNKNKLSKESNIQMKKIITALLSIAALNSVTVTADTLDDVADRGTLRGGVVINNAWP
jgi:hypothetical protein